MQALNTQIQPLGGGLRCMVPEPSGIRAVGDGALLPPLCVRVRGLADEGVLGCDAVVGEPTEVTGVTGFMRSPLIQAGGGTAGCEGGAERGGGYGDRGGGGGSTFSRWAFRYSLLFATGVRGNAGVRLGLFVLDRVGEVFCGGG